MTEIEIGKLLEEAERRIGIKADTTLFSENITIDPYRKGPNSTLNADLTIDFYSQEPNSLVSAHEHFSVPHPKTQEQREKFIKIACDKLTLLRQKRIYRHFNSCKPAI
ncbi:MAG TPA: hypothetical protein VHE60_05650 [Pyrinomonadaceae bacterium]|nr:hypothetical protein [Pyrinomonadaceae bacterium]